MGKPTGFLEIERQVSTEVEPLKRIKNFNEFHKPLSRDEQSCQGARCMDWSSFLSKWKNDSRNGIRLSTKQLDT